MVKMTNDSIGIDISNDHLDVYRLTDGHAARFTNAGVEKRFAGTLPLVKVNPLQARRFAQSKGTRAKTDAVDASMLAEMGAAFGLVADRPTDENQRTSKSCKSPAWRWSGTRPDS